MNKNKKYVNIFEFEEEAASHLNRNSYVYYKSGANGEHTLRNNVDDFPKILLNPFVCAGLNQIDVSSSILGFKTNLPIGIAPTAMQKMANDKGELNLARTAKKNNTVYTLSTLSTTSMDEVAKYEQDGLLFFQLYITKNRKITETMVKDAENLGFKAIVLTVDAPWLGIREGDEKNNFCLPSNLKLEILAKYSDQMTVKSDTEGSSLLNFFSTQLEQALKWEDIQWLKSITKLPVILKGIQNGQDALKAAELGAHIWVSNHGGRQLDTVRSTIGMLNEIVHSVKNYKGKIEVYVDGGIRRGTDVVKCLALGANFVFVGRPIIYANACEGEQGLQKMFDIFTKELKYAMMLLGVGKVADLSEKHIVRSSIPPSNL